MKNPIRPILTGYLIACAICISILSGCAKLPVTGEPGIVHETLNPMTLDEWIDSEDGQGGGSR